VREGNPQLFAKPAILNQLQVERELYSGVPEALDLPAHKRQLA